MKQLKLFEECYPEDAPLKTQGIEWKLYIDGASRKNPGNAGAGVYLLKNDELAFKKGFYLGHKTNNQAEYYALLIGVFYSKKYMNSADVLYVYSDSELMIRQIKREYKIKNPELKKLYDLALHLLEDVRYTVCHVLRDKNIQADAMANEGIDKKGKLPLDFMRLVQAHGIVL